MANQMVDHGHIPVSSCCCKHQVGTYSEKSFFLWCVRVCNSIHPQSAFCRCFLYLKSFPVLPQVFVLHPPMQLTITQARSPDAVKTILIPCIAWIAWPGTGSNLSYRVWPGKVWMEFVLSVIAFFTIPPISNADTIILSICIFFLVHKQLSYQSGASFPVGVLSGKSTLSIAKKTGCFSTTNGRMYRQLYSLIFVFENGICKLSLNP